MTCALKVLCGQKPFVREVTCGGKIVTDGREDSPDFYYECLSCGATWSDGRRP